MPRARERGVTHDTARRTMVRAAMRAPYLERDEEHMLARRWRERQDQHALQPDTRRDRCRQSYVYSRWGGIRRESVASFVLRGKA